MDTALKPVEIIEKAGIDSIIERIAKGEQQTQIADSLGISDAILSYHLEKHPRHLHAVESHHRRKLDEVDTLHDTAIDDRDFDLARAREAQFKRRSWRASVEARRIYGQNVDLTTKGEQIEQMDTATIARRVAFLLRKGLEDGDTEDAEIVAETPMLQSNSTVRQNDGGESGSSD